MRSNDFVAVHGVALPGIRPCDTTLLSFKIPGFLQLAMPDMCINIIL